MPKYSSQRAAKRQQKFLLNKAAKAREAEQTAAKVRRGELSELGFSPDAIADTLVLTYHGWQSLKRAEAEAALKRAEEDSSIRTCLESKEALPAPQAISPSPGFSPGRPTGRTMMTFLMVAALVCGCATGAEGAVLPQGSDGKKFGRKGSGAKKTKQQSEDRSKPTNSNTEAKSKSPSSTASPGAPKAKEPASAPPANVGFFKPAANSNSGVEDITLKPSPPAVAHQFSPTFTSCQAVTPDFIKHFYVADTSPADIDKATAAIMDVRNSDPVIASYIDTVFNYLPGFRIQLLSSGKEVRKLIGTSHGDGAYDASTRIFYLSHRATIDEYDKTLVRHEFRHALMHALQIARSKFAPVMESECYFPLTDSERTKVNSLIEEGDREVEKLRALLRREENKNLTAEEKNYLEQLRKISSDTYQENYLTHTHIKYSEKYELLAKKNNNVMRLRGCGLVRLMGRVVHEGETLLKWELLDPLWGLVNNFDNQITPIKKKYPTEKYLRERDAHLFQLIPMPLIKILYPAYYQYIQEFVANTPFPEKIHLHSMVNHDFAYLKELAVEKLLTQPKYFSVSQADNMAKVLRVYVDLKLKLDQCVIGAKTLIANNIKVGEAHLCLADIAYLRHDRPLAATHYEIALNSRSVVLEAAQCFKYVESLFFIKKYEQAANICRRVLKNPPDLLGDTKDKLEELLARIEEIRMERTAPSK